MKRGALQERASTPPATRHRSLGLTAAGSPRRELGAETAVRNHEPCRVAHRRRPPAATDRRLLRSRRRRSPFAWRPLVRPDRARVVRRGSDRPSRSVAPGVYRSHTAGGRCWRRAAVSKRTSANLRWGSEPAPRRSSPARPSRQSFRSPSARLGLPLSPHVVGLPRTAARS